MALAVSVSDLVKIIKEKNLDIAVPSLSWIYLQFVPKMFLHIHHSTTLENLESSIWFRVCGSTLLCSFNTNVEGILC